MTSAEPLTWSTEQRNPRTTDLDTLASDALVARIIDEDAVVPRAVAAVGADLARAVDLAVAALGAGGRVHYVGAGTSGRLGVLDAVELLPTYKVTDDLVVAHLAGGDAAMMRAVEGAEDDAEAGARIADEAGPHDLIVGIAASGRTPFVRGALQRARERGLATVLVSSNTQAPIAQFADVAVLPDTGPEVVTGSTRMKAATAQKLVLNTFSTATMVRLGKVWSNLMINVVATNAKLERRLVRIVEFAAGVGEEEAAAALAQASGDLRVAIVIAAGGVDAPRAREVLAAHQPDPTRAGDPSGLRTALAALTA